MLAFVSVVSKLYKSQMEEGENTSALGIHCIISSVHTFFHIEWPRPRFCLGSSMSFGHSKCKLWQKLSESPEGTPSFLCFGEELVQYGLTVL